MKQALRVAVEALGGSKAVGHTLWPAKDVSDAERRLDHCLERNRADRLSDEQIDWIFDNAAAIGAHEAIQGWGRGRGAGYTVTPTAPELALSEALARAMAAKQATEESARDLTLLIENPRLLATMRAAGLKIE